MKKYLILLIISFSFLYSDSSTTFIEKQKLIIKTKKIIEEEEFIARAFERYILENAKIPTLSDLKNNNYLSTTFSPTYFTEDDSKDFSIISRKNKMKNRLTLSVESVRINSGIADLYNSSTYRNRTYLDGTEIGIFIRDDFARHIYFLSSTADIDIVTCSDSNRDKYCIENDHMYIYKRGSDKSKDILLMYYKLSKFRTGPIIIVDDPTIYDNSEFEHIPSGAILFDIKGKKHIKTNKSIVRIQ